MTGGFGAVPEELYRTANRIGDVVGSAGSMLWQGPSGDYGHPGVQTGWGSFIEDVKAEVGKLAKKAEGHGEDLRTAAVKYADSDSAASEALGKLGGGLLGGLEGAPGGGITGGIGGVLGGGELGIGLSPIGGKLGSGLDPLGVAGGEIGSGLDPFGESDGKVGSGLDPHSEVGGGAGGEAGSRLGPLGGEARIGSGLEGVPGGGFAGGLTPSQLNERLGGDGGGLHDEVPGGGWAGGATGKISGSLEDGPTGVMSPERSRELFPGSSGGTTGSDGEGPVY
ncbi:WXG100 family type VII secretion target [Amycolatopsis sp. NBC_01480]|uniref:WXG100 family type VII secretion target n=1 Tax=Amycolatopsis sp. NBC_01480 TaxID=2903562 RepID=UPI002E2D0BD4|nr:hypothetical protein [Amycolatopsis sp. NBC_01480]